MALLVVVYTITTISFQINAHPSALSHQQASVYGSHPSKFLRFSEAYDGNKSTSNYNNVINKIEIIGAGNIGGNHYWISSCDPRVNISASK